MHEISGRGRIEPQRGSLVLIPHPSLPSLLHSSSDGGGDPMEPAMALVASSQSNKTLKFFSLKLYKIRARFLNFLIQNVGSFTTQPTPPSRPIVGSVPK